MSSGSSNNNTKYNPNKVITEANDKLTAGDYGGGVFLFQSALLQWTDDAREDRTVDNGEAVATLWLAYTQYLIQGHQFKSASDAFEEAMDNCPHSGRIFAEAARHALERNKRTKAQNIYLRALLSSPSSGSAPAISDEQDQDLLWNDFLEMKREDEPNLTLKELKQAVQDEFMAGRHNNEDVFNQKKAEDTDEDDPDQQQQQHSESTKKRAKLTTAGLDNSNQGNKTHVVTQDAVDDMAGTIDLDELPEDIMLAWLSYDGPGAPQRPDITLFTPSPPKLADPVRIITSWCIAVVSVFLSRRRILASSFCSLLLPSRQPRIYWALTWRFNYRNAYWNRPARSYWKRAALCGRYRPSKKRNVSSCYKTPRRYYWPTTTSSRAT
jgi:tetratricopeptide (TPR) repeat protein